MVRGLRSTDNGNTWDALNVFPHFGVAGYDLTVLIKRLGCFNLYRLWRWC